MPRNLVPILVKLGRNTAGKFDWPDFDAIDPAIRGDMRWSQYVDAHGLGWKYARELTPEEAEANIHCVAGTLVPPDFAAAAVALFPERIVPLSEAEWTDYFEQRVQPPGRDELLDVQELQSLAALAQLDQLGLLDAPAKAVLTKRLAAATNPGDPAPGIRANPNRTWEQVKQRRGVAVDAAIVRE